MSFTWLGIPSRIGNLVYQGGLHPYIHIIICAVVGLAMLWRGRKTFFGEPSGFHPFYKLFLIGLVGILTLQTFLQIIFNGNGLLNIGALTLTYMLLAIYAFAVPKVLSIDDMMKHTVSLGLGIIVLSLLVKFTGSPEVYKGNRFIGIFKHIPHMVSCASLGFIFILNSWTQRAGVKQKLFFWVCLSLFAYVVILTGTRSALFACLVAIVSFFFLLRSPNPQFQMGRVLAVWVLGIAVVLFGSFGFNYAKDLITGKTALGARETQNGIEERFEEIYRGVELFEKSPYMGLGLLSKFSDGDSEMVDSYNSFQDPHNMFLSAAVVGGWPLAIWVGFGTLLLIVSTFKNLRRRETPYLTIGCYIAGHLPILLIYHIHLSIGGIADRYYWLIFAYMAGECLKSPSGIVVE